MAYNKINKLPQNVFTGLFRLRNLDLSNNQIEELNSSVFSACQELQYLDLSHNKLTELSPEVFSGIAALQVHIVPIIRMVLLYILFFFFPD